MFTRDPYNPLHCCTTIAVEEIKHLGRWKVRRGRYKKDVLTECLSRIDATQTSACTSTQYLHIRLAHNYSKSNQLYYKNIYHILIV